MDWVVAAHWLNCSKVDGILPDQVSSAWQDGFLTTGPPGKPRKVYFRKMNYPTFKPGLSPVQIPRQPTINLIGILHYLIFIHSHSFEHTILKAGTGVEAGIQAPQAASSQVFAVIA